MAKELEWKVYETIGESQVSPSAVKFIGILIHKDMIEDGECDGQLEEMLTSEHEEWRLAAQKRYNELKGLAMEVGTILSRDEAFKLAPELVRHTEGEHDLFDEVNDMMNGMKKKQKALCAVTDYTGNNIPTHYKVVQVTKVDNDCIQAEDGPVIRVSDGKSTFRIDGCYWVVPI